MKKKAHEPALARVLERRGMTLRSWLVEEGLVDPAAAMALCRERGMLPPAEADLLSALAEVQGPRMSKNPDGVLPVRVSHDYRSGLVRTPARKKRGRDDDQTARDEVERPSAEQDHGIVVATPVEVDLVVPSEHETGPAGITHPDDDQGTRHDA